ncbi:hypothetical protein BDZ88DRAFT_412000 [Geranomyces variabilis]|nr:hypothetical protein BDZ88DRAFT_412000 [Geranomyces variabilis]KAJ3134901.1 hypothetical protein HDU90_004225 [Geranomyces variabilis]
MSFLLARRLGSAAASAAIRTPQSPGVQSPLRSLLLLACPSASPVPQWPAPLQARAYRRHTFETLVHEGGSGRSVMTYADKAAQAYFRLRDVVQESRLRETVRAQERFERNSDKRRRKKKEKQWKAYMRVVRKRVQVAWDLKNRTARQKEVYEDI